MEISDDKYYTVEEYFAILEDSEEKYEYHNGKLYGMAGGKPIHNKLSVNTIIALGNALSDKDCIVYNSDQQVSIDNQNRYVFPDLSVVCGPEEFDGERGMSLKNPILIIEVLSESTKAFDKTTKFHLYCKIPSFREYILIHTDRIEIDAYYKEESGMWRISSGFRLDDKIHLHSIGIDLLLSDVYKKIKGLKEEI